MCMAEAVRTDVERIILAVEASKKVPGILTRVIGLLCDPTQASGNVCDAIAAALLDGPLPEQACWELGGKQSHMVRASKSSVFPKHLPWSSAYSHFSAPP